MGESDYLNDNALRKMDIFLSLLFSEERMFFSLISVQSFQENLISGEKMSLARYILARENAGYDLS